MIVTIVTAVKNGEATVLDTINSVKQQTYKNIEHVVIDSISTDNTLEIVKKNIKSFSKIISEPDTGIYDGLNKGFKNSIGEIIGILNADDFYADSKAIEEVVKEFTKKDINFLYADLEYVERKNHKKIFRKWISGTFELNKLSFGWMPPHPTIFFKKSLVEDMGGFSLEYLISSDYDFMLRYLLSPKMKVGYLPKTIIKMRNGGVSNKSIVNITKKSLEDYKIIKTHKIGGVVTLLLKNLRKVPQLYQK